jgi:hypothetical protein
MQTFTISATVEPSGQLVIGELPFAPGTEVVVVVSPRANSAAEFEAAWNELCVRLRQRPDLASLEEDQIEQEVAQYRAER